MAALCRSARFGWVRPTPPRDSSPRLPASGECPVPSRCGAVPRSSKPAPVVRGQAGRSLWGACSRAEALLPVAVCSGARPRPQHPRSRQAGRQKPLPYLWPRNPRPPPRPPGTTDQARVRHLILALPPHHAARLLEAREDGVGEDDLREIAAEALGEIYFRDNGRRAHGLEVELTDHLDLEFEL